VTSEERRAAKYKETTWLVDAAVDALLRKYSSLFKATSPIHSRSKILKQYSSCTFTSKLPC
jgi:hypothetical protein